MTQWKPRTFLAQALRTLGSGNQIAMVRVTRETIGTASQRRPVRVGVAGTGGSYGSAGAIGLSFDLTGSGQPQVATELAVVIREAASGKALWEGRASFTVAATSPLASTQLGAVKLAQALFAGFPGTSGETITVAP